MKLNGCIKIELLNKISFYVHSKRNFSTQVLYIRNAICNKALGRARILLIGSIDEHTMSEPLDTGGSIVRIPLDNA